MDIYTLPSRVMARQRLGWDENLTNVKLCVMRTYMYKSVADRGGGKLEQNKKKTEKRKIKEGKIHDKSFLYT